ncbi:MAG: uncharacterized membrane protein (DUF485 family) [Crocinitomix sp.]|jgi:uncharacterized membrane protein (DUF485 family)
MLVNYTLWITLAIIGCLILIIGLALLWKKFKKKMVAGGTIGFFLSFILFAVMFVMPTNVYVVDGDKEFTRYAMLGDATYTCNSGSEIKLKGVLAECDIINDSDEGVVVEQVIYGFALADNQLIDIEENMHFESTSIEFFFDNEPPETIETSSTASGVYKNWIQMESDFSGDLGGFDFETMHDLLDDE